jgi:tripeptidyl-peptidase-2
MLPSQKTVTSVSVIAGITCELDLARYWSARGMTRMKVHVQFRGVKTVNGRLNMLTGRGGTSATLCSALRDEYVLPEAKLHTWRSPLNPIGEGLISPCDERDILQAGEKQIYQLILTYELDQKQAGKIKPVVPALQGLLYESPFESQLIQIFDEDKKLLGVVDSWPDGVDVPKGKISLRLQIRHDDLHLLDGCKHMSIFIEKKLDKKISLSVHCSHESMMKGTAMRRRLLRKGTFAHIVFSEPDADALPSGSKCGDVLFGNATFVDSSSTLPSEGNHLGVTSIMYVLKDNLDLSNNEPSAKEPELSDERSFGEKINEKILNLKVDELKNLSDDTEFETFYEELAQENAKHLPLLLAGLKYFDKEDKRKEKLDKVVSLADQILSIIDENDLSLHFGAEYDTEDAKSCKVSECCELKRYIDLTVLKGSNQRRNIF